ncbi:rRNA biogenesis protein rrp5 [Proteinivorax tanatarense]|uniref:rRNA biogenesis protein rrp5 n=1 Tax=Proteinivorax tanatarense TaxID=1260629 RepID=A0AAU7VHV4_9FIRM
MSKTKLAFDVVSDLKSLANSIETLVEALEENKTEAAPKEKEQPKINQPTIEELRAAMAEKNREGHREKIKAIIHKYGANKLTALDPKDYADILKEVSEIK